MPPKLSLPNPPEKVRISGPAGNLTVSWQAPREDVGGRPLQAVAGYRVLRAAWPPGEEACDACPEDLEPVANLDPLARRAEKLPDTSWVDHDVRSGWTYRYRLQTLDQRGRPGPPSQPVQIEWVALSPPEVEIRPGDRQAVVRVTKGQWPEGLQPLGVRVHSSGRAVQTGADPVAREVLVSGLKNGSEYTFDVRWAATTREGWIIESPGSQVSGTPVDTTPPLPPSELVAFRVAEGVRVRWLPSGREPYQAIVLFRAEGRGKPVEIARVPGEQLIYLDATVLPDRVYSYTAVAIDSAGNRSLPTREARVRFREGAAQQ